jgi:hypothetical protein
MSARNTVGGAAEHVIPIARGAISYPYLNGKPYQLRTWTASEWARLPEEDRPEGAWPHGDGRALIEPRQP